MKKLLLFIAAFYLIIPVGMNDLKAQSWNLKGPSFYGTSANQNLGNAVSLSADGKTFAVSAIEYDLLGVNTNKGYVKIYTWNGSAWVQKGATLIGENVGDQFGTAIDLSTDGNSIAISAPSNGGGIANFTGVVKVYTWSGSAWVQKGADIMGKSNFDYSGNALSLSNDGNTLAIGSDINGDNGIQSGHVRIFSWNGSAWVQKGNDLQGQNEDDRYGFSVSLSADGNTVVAGAPYNKDNGNTSGHVIAYSWIGTAWVKKGMEIIGSESYSLTGSSVSLSDDGNILAVGARIFQNSSTKSGQVRIFKFESNNWVQIGNDIIGNSGNEESGHAVCISGDGNIVVIGAPKNENKGSETGRVRVFNWNGTEWIQRGPDLIGDNNENAFGWSVCISSNGSLIGVGAILNSEKGNEAGQAKVYEYQFGVGLQNNEMLSVLKYNNPTTGELTVELGYEYATVNAKITNVHGQVIASELFHNSNQLKLNIDGAAGIYFVEISTSNGSKNTLKVIKK
jgi:hypothetical protein